MLAFVEQVYGEFSHIILVIKIFLTKSMYDFCNLKVLRSFMGGSEIEIYFGSINLCYFNFKLKYFDKNNSRFYYKWPKSSIFQKLLINRLGI